MFGSKDLPARTVASRLPPPKGNLQTPARPAETVIPYIPRPAIEPGGHVVIKGVYGALPLSYVDFRQRWESNP